MKYRIEEVISLIAARDIRGLTRAISIVENDWEGREELLDYAFKKGSNGCLTVGFTGAPGVGKSTLINCVIKEYRLRGKTVGVIAVDPSSPFSGGALLGDRVRMSDHNPDPGVYIRSIASRKAIGGLSEATKYVLYMYKAFGFDVIIIETLGVGQDEIDVSHYVDVSAVILVPGYGDTVQMAKAGIIEIADFFIINKSDKPGADTAKNQLANALFSRPDRNHVNIVSTIAEQGKGITEVVQAIEEAVPVDEAVIETKFKKRIAEEIRSAILSRIGKDIDKYIENYTGLIKEASMTPIDASSEILKLIGNSKS